MITKEQATKIATENFHKMEEYKNGFFKSIEYVAEHDNAHLFHIKKNTKGGHHGPSIYCTVDFDGNFNKITDLRKLSELTYFHCSII